MNKVIVTGLMAENFTECKWPITQFNMAEIMVRFFLTAIWLPHDQRPLLRGQPHSPDVNHCVFNPRITGSLLARLGPLARPSA